MTTTRRGFLTGGVVAAAVSLAWLADRGSGNELTSGERLRDQRRDEGRRRRGHRMEPVPERFTIVPDDYHVPYAGTAEDGRKFFLSRELFDFEHSYIGLFLWKADGTYDRVEATRVDRPRSVPPGMAGAAGPDELFRDTLASLGDYTLEPIDVEPFLTKINGTKFGWHTGHYRDGTAYINVEPGNFICYYAPWDGLGYDT